MISLFYFIVTLVGDPIATYVRRLYGHKESVITLILACTPLLSCSLSLSLSQGEPCSFLRGVPIFYFKICRSKNINDHLPTGSYILLVAFFGVVFLHVVSLV